MRSLDREIFYAALKTMNARADESFYVGDVYSVDYVGATNAGMQAVLFDVAGAYRDRQEPRVESLAQLESWLHNNCCSKIFRIMPDPRKVDAVSYRRIVCWPLRPDRECCMCWPAALAGGKREGVLSALGTFLGGMVHVLAAALGVSVILARSALAFSTVKYSGAAYLCFLGVRMIIDARKNGEKEAVPDSFATITVRRAIRYGRALQRKSLNPKTALFFLSFIPQFVNRGAGHVFFQFVTLGTASVILNTSADMIVILLAGPLGKRFARRLFPPSTANVDGRHHDWAWELIWRPAKAIRRLFIPGVLTVYNSRI